MLKGPINVFFFVPGKQLGGCTSFTVHLMKTFEALGYQPRLFRAGKGEKETTFPYGLRATTVTPERAFALAQGAPSIIAYCFWSKCSAYAKPLIELNVPMVVHDPAEFHLDELDLMRSRGYSPLVIRKANVLGLRESGVTARFVPHPYVAVTPRQSAKLFHALCLSRIDFRKRTHVILDANKELDARHAVHLYGEINRVYEFHQLRKLHPGWKRWYHGEFPDAFGQAVHMFNTARFAVDLTHIKGDGGGTQYTFFEAWNAGIPLVLNKAWSTGHDDEVKNGGSCVMVENASELIGVLQHPLEGFAGVVDGGRAIVEAHAPSVVGPQYLEAMQ